ncbi:MAG: amidohydrolase family protein [Chloroflexota bacterium]
MIAEREVVEQTTSTTQTREVVIDCDIHNFEAYKDPEYVRVYKTYLEEKWQRHHETFGLRGFLGGGYPRAQVNAARQDSFPPSGKPPGMDLDFMREQLLDEWNMDYGILNPLGGGAGQLNLDYAAALTRAMNDYQIAEWLEPEPRLRASLSVVYEDGDLAAEEIYRLGDHEGFVQVLLVARTREPLGRRKYWKMYEAAVEHNLPLGIHFGGAGGGPITASGWPSYYIEDHAGMPQTFQAQIASMVCEGVFEHFPSLRVVIIEGGFAWLPSLAWRLDQSWSRLKEEVPQLKRAPSEYINEHFWLTTQPMEEPRQNRHFMQLLEELNGSEKLMFATDYPHWDFDSPGLALPTNLPREMRRNIMSENARAFYELD